MSLAIALKAFDGLVLASDSRTVEEYTLDGPRTRDDAVKFIKLTEDFGLLTYGLSDIGSVGIAWLKEEISRDLNRHRRLSDILETSTRVFRHASRDWGQRHPRVRRRDADVGFLLGGYCREDQELVVFRFLSPSFSPERVRTACAIAGQWYIAKFFVRRFCAGPLRLNELKDIAVFLLTATMVVDETVGGAIRLATIAPSSGFQWVSQAELRSISEKNRTLSEFIQRQLHTLLLGDDEEKKRR